MCHSRSAAVPALLLSVGLAAGGCGLNISANAEARDEWKKQYDVGAAATVEIRNTNGRINIRSGDGSKVDVRVVRIVRAPTDEAAKEALASFKIDETSSPDRVVLNAASANAGFTIGLSRTAEFDVTVPRDVHVILETTNGEITATALSGRLRATGTNGRISTEALTGPVEIELTNGEVRLDLAAVHENGVSAETTNGAISLSLAPDAKARLAVRTSNGGVSTDGVDLAVTQHSRQRFDATVGGGGPTIRLETTNGGIRIGSRAVERR